MDERGHLFVGGAWSEAAGDDAIEVVSPHSEEAIATVAAAGPDDVDRAVTAARAAYDDGPWPRLAPAERIAAVRRLAELYRGRRREMAQLITAEMGAPITFSTFAQATLPMMLVSSFADVAERHPWEEARPGAFGEDVLVRRHPLGVVAAIVPWNMPQFLVVGKLAPALLAGCSVVVKPAPETPLDALVLAEPVAELDLPPGVVSVLPGGPEVGEALVGHPGVDKVAFTGSTAVGRQVAAACGAALKRASLKLGGKSAAIVLDDAEPASVAAGVKVAGLMNSGQACVAQTRVLVARRQQQRVRHYIEEGTRQGARLVVGGTARHPTRRVRRRRPLRVHQRLRPAVRHAGGGRRAGRARGRPPAVP